MSLFLFVLVAETEFLRDGVIAITQPELRLYCFRHPVRTTLHNHKNGGLVVPTDSMPSE